VVKAAGAAQASADAGAGAGAMPATRAKPDAAMRFIMLVVLIDMMAVGLIVPVLPAWVGQFTTSADEQAAAYSLVTFSFALASFIGAPLLGALSDRFGRRPVLLLGFMGLAINFFWTAAATSLWMLVASRVVGGGMQANAAVANAYVADIIAPEERARRFGLLGAMFGLGFILGPAMGGVLGEVPVFGICLGHQLLSHALGLRTEKLPFGHRGANHPVQRAEDGVVEITVQNHGYAVVADSLPDGVQVTRTSLFDGSVEGIAAPDLMAASVQYHPEARPGPHDAAYLFRAFRDRVVA
jgi:hypothetical protein